MNVTNMSVMADVMPCAPCLGVGELGEAHEVSFMDCLQKAVQPAGSEYSKDVPAVTKQSGQNSEQQAIEKYLLEKVGFEYVPVNREIVQDFKVELKILGEYMVTNLSDDVCEDKRDIFRELFMIFRMYEFDKIDELERLQAITSVLVKYGVIKIDEIEKISEYRYKVGPEEGMAENILPTKDDTHYVPIAQMQSAETVQAPQGTDSGNKVRGNAQHTAQPEQLHENQPMTDKSTQGQSFNETMKETVQAETKQAKAQAEPIMTAQTVQAEENLNFNLKSEAKDSGQIGAKESEGLQIKLGALQLNVPSQTKSIGESFQEMIQNLIEAGKIHLKSGETLMVRVSEEVRLPGAEKPFTAVADELVQLKEIAQANQPREVVKFVEPDELKKLFSYISKDEQLGDFKKQDTENQSLFTKLMNSSDVNSSGEVNKESAKFMNQSVSVAKQVSAAIIERIEQINEITMSRINVSEKPTVTKFEMTLNPEQLGKVEVKLTVIGMKMSVMIITASDEVRDLLLSRMSSVRVMVELNGITVERYEVVSSQPQNSELNVAKSEQDLLDEEKGKNQGQDNAEKDTGDESEEVEISFAEVVSEIQQMI
jgi:flagellar hook-length control protein FliK